MGRKKVAQENEGGKRRRRGRNRSAFIREHLAQFPNATAKDVAEAWTAAKHRGKLSPTLYYQIKRREGLSGGKGKRKGRGKARAAPGGGGYLAIEQQLDGLVAMALVQGDAALGEALRAARRHVSARILAHG